MTGRRSRSGRSERFGSNASARAALALGLAAALGCAALPKPKALGPAPHPLEHPPASEDLTGRLEFRVAHAEETLIDLAPELAVGYVELLAANRTIDPWLPPEGARLVVPKARLLPSGPRQGIVVNLGDLRLYYFTPDAPPRSYPIGIAKDGYATPLGTTRVTTKRENPSWTPGPSARRDDPTLKAQVPPGPDNPLGLHALYLGWPSYLIHGTNEPRGVGRHSSRGCIRLYPEHIAELYAEVAIGTSVRVVNQPVKLGWIGGELHLEVNPDAEQSLALDETGRFEPVPPEDLRKLVLAAAGYQAARVDWDRVERAGRARAGVPVVITRATPVAAQ